MPTRPTTHRVSPCKPHTTRKPAVERGYDWRWHKASKAFLAANPLCYYCDLLGLVVVARHTDHYNPPSGPDDPLFWMEENWRAACARCNSAKRGTMGDQYVAALLARGDTRGRGGSNP